MKLIIEVVTIKRVLKFRERATTVIFNELPAYRMWVNGSYKIINQLDETVYQGHIKALPPYYRVMSGWSGMEDLVEVCLMNQAYSKLVDPYSNRHLIRLSPGLLKSGYEIRLDVPGNNHLPSYGDQRVRRDRSRNFDFRAHLNSIAVSRGDFLIAKL